MTEKLLKKDERREARKPYSSPKLFVHGDVARLTRSLLKLGWLSGKRSDFSEPT